MTKHNYSSTTTTTTTNKNNRSTVPVVRFLLVALFGLTATTWTAAAAPSPLDTVDTEAYLGRWYQTYASATVKWTFELGGNCVTADYGATSEPDVITVRNIVRPLKLLGFLRRFLPLKGIRIRGFAAQSPDGADGALSVVLGTGADSAAETSFDPPGNYWIIALGPIVNGLYDWAVVSGPDQKQLYVLVRDVGRFRREYESEILPMLYDMGFTKWNNKPRKTNQVGCFY